MRLGYVEKTCHPPVCPGQRPPLSYLESGGCAGIFSKLLSDLNSAVPRQYCNRSLGNAAPGNNIIHDK